MVPDASIDFFFIQKKSKSFSFILLVYLSITNPGFLFLPLIASPNGGFIEESVRKVVVVA